MNVPIMSVEGSDDEIHILRGNKPVQQAQTCADQNSGGLLVGECEAVPLVASSWRPGRGHHSGCGQSGLELASIGHVSGEFAILPGIS